jgi:predicted ATP-grasp superfamily ATP-dependent carboligase
VLLGNLDLLRPLALRKIPVVLVAWSPEDPTLRSRHLRGHAIFGARTPDERARALLELGARLEATLGGRVPLVYGSDADLEMLYAHRDELSRHYLFLLNDPEIGWSLHDKERFHDLAERAGVLTPKTVAGEGDLACLREPILVKPKTKVDWHAIQHDLFGGAGKARVFATRREALEHPGVGRHRGDLIFQECIEAGVDDLHSFHGFADAEGKLLGWFSGRKIRTYPRVAGESAHIELTREPDVERQGRAAAARLALKGPFKIDLIRDRRTGALYTLEVNARYNLWHHLGAVHGVNLPAIAYDYLVHHQVAPPPAYTPRVRWQNIYRDYLALREDGVTPDLRWLRDVAGVGVIHEVFDWADPMPCIKLLGGVFYKKLVARPPAVSPPASAAASRPETRPAMRSDKAG